MNRLVSASIFTILTTAASLAKQLPTISIFLKESCPHTLKAMPAIRQLARDVKGKATLNVVMDISLGELAKAKKKFGVKFNFLPADATKIRQLGGKHSLDAIVQSSSGIVTFDGLGPKFLAEVAKATGVKLSSKLYPAKRVSGCGF